MTDRPILFSAPMVRALLDGRKTQTRRALSPANLRIWTGGLDFAGRHVKPSPEHFATAMDDARDMRMVEGNHLLWSAQCPINGGYAPAQGLVTYAPKDRLYVRETWAVGSIYDKVKPRDINPGGKPGWCGIRYAATDTRSGIKDRPSIHMPRWASRLTLTVTDVRVERLQDCSEVDAVAEGVQEPSLRNLGGACAQAAMSERQMYARLWDHINGPGAWEANPWVLAVSFVVSRANIDQAPQLRCEQCKWAGQLVDVTFANDAEDGELTNEACPVCLTDRHLKYFWDAIHG